MDHPPIIDTPRHRFFAKFLSLFLILFILDPVVSFLNAGLTWLVHCPVLSLPLELIGLFGGVIGLLAYSSMGIFAIVPKRYLVALLLFQVGRSMTEFFLSILLLPQLFHHPLLGFPLEMLFDGLQVMMGLYVIHWIRGDLSWSWPLFPIEKLAARRFQWLTFLEVNLAALGLLVGLVLYLGLCAMFAVDYLSGGFLVLHPNRLCVREKTFTRSDGKTVELIPMIHFGDDQFYTFVSGSIPEQATVLMEGVTDREHLLTEKLDYGPLASTFHLSSQSKEFKVTQKTKRYADVDISEFSKPTIKALNQTIHGMNILVRFLEDPSDFESISNVSEVFEQKLNWNAVLDDILVRRNEHLIGEIQIELARTDFIAVPWGAAHLPAISEALVKEGFRESDKHEYPVIKFYK